MLRVIFWNALLGFASGRVFKFWILIPIAVFQFVAAIALYQWPSSLIWFAVAIVASEIGYVVAGLLSFFVPPTKKRRPPAKSF
ncbi:MAG: hypothetical protein MN733_26935 [Nitrososphaera sp.]|nr:hypothetical protein [Nitrososphaera sp.]